MNRSAALAPLLTLLLAFPATAGCADGAKPGVDWQRCNQQELNLAGADLKDAILRETRLMRADLAGANLERARAAEADFTRADLTGAKLDDADLLHA